jgi:hypothetical protein
MSVAAPPAPSGVPPQDLEDEVIDLLAFAQSSHLNLMATVSRGYGGRHHLLLWSYDKARLLAACAMPPPATPGVCVSVGAHVSVAWCPRSRLCTTALCDLLSISLSPCDGVAVAMQAAQRHP